MTPYSTSTNLIVSGPIADVKLFLEIAKTDKQPLSFNKLVPRPIEIEEDDSFDWNDKNWGTNEDCYNVNRWNIVNIDHETSRADIHYYTAWTQATRLWLTVSKQFPSLKFFHEFVDEGGAFLGDETFENGKMINSNNHDWHSKNGINALKRLN